MKVPIEEVREVFDHWLKVCRNSNKGIRPVLSDKRVRLIRRAVGDYGVENCMLAIDGCALSEWHQGKNPRGKKYDNIELILRDSEHIERFADLALNGTSNARDEFLNE